MVGAITRHFRDDTGCFLNKDQADAARRRTPFPNDAIPKQGFYVDKSGILYLDGDQVLNEKVFDARSKKRGEDCRKHPEEPLSLKEIDDKLLAQFMPAAFSLAKVWDDTYQEGRMSTKMANATHIPGHVLVWNGKGMRWEAQVSSGDQAAPDNYVNLNKEHIEEIVEKTIEHQETQINLLQAQVDSLQSQINIAHAVNIEEAFADEKFDSFKNRAKETLKEAYAVIEDMEGLDQLQQAKAIKEAALTENRKQLVLTHERVRERLEKLQERNNSPEKSRQSDGIPVKRIIFAVVFIALAAVYGPAILALIF